MSTLGLSQLCPLSLTAAVRYRRPKNLTVQGLITLEKFSLSSNVVINSPVSLLRFLVEDVSLNLSQQQSNPTVNIAGMTLTLL